MNDKTFMLDVDTLMEMFATVYDLGAGSGVDVFRDCVLKAGGVPPEGALEACMEIVKAIEMQNLRSRLEQSLTPINPEGDGSEVSH